MDWVSGIKRNGDNELCAEVQNEQGFRTLKYLGDIDGSLYRKGDTKSSLTINLMDAKTVSTAQYLADLGLQHLDDSCQTTYLFDTAEGHFVLPSQSLIMSIIGMKLNLRRVLLEPWGLESFMTAFRVGNQIRYQIISNRPVAKDTFTTEQYQKHLRWFVSFPSARSAWSSVYRNALEGRFDATLPTAQVTLNVFCRKFKDKFLVTRAALSSIKALEAPHAFTKGCSVAMSVTYACSINKRKTSLCKMTPDLRVKHLVPGFRLTDQQWNHIEPILDKLSMPTRRSIGKLTAPSTRLLLDAIFVKLGTPLGWKNQIFPNVGTRALWLFYRLQKSGTWDAILEALQTQSEVMDSFAMSNANNTILRAA